jgi:hypothetical protein
MVFNPSFDFGARSGIETKKIGVRNYDERNR